MQKVVLAVATFTMVVCFASPSFGHMVFKKALGKKYSNMKISCNACHVKSKPKTERNEFGKLFYKELKDKELSRKFGELTGDDKKAFAQDVMVPEFKKALEKIKKLKKKDTEKTYDELIKEGEISGIKLKPAED